MFFEELKQFLFFLSKSLNNILSKYFNNGVLISEEKFNIILNSFFLLILILFIIFWFWKKRVKSFFNNSKRTISNENEKNFESKKDSEIIHSEKIASLENILKEENEEDSSKKNQEIEEEKFSREESQFDKIRQINENVDNNKDNKNEVQNSLFGRIQRGIEKTRKQLISNISNVILGKKQIDGDLLDELEEVLIGSDIGPKTTLLIIESITAKVERNELKEPKKLQEEIKNEIFKIMDKNYPLKKTANKKPLIFLIVGVNGVGKTTTIGKIASQYRQKGKKVLMGAGDTFRAAAIEQLYEWSIRADCDILKKEPGSDPSSVIHDTVKKGIDENFDVVICDTAGRLHTKKNLMEELKKMVRVIQKFIPDAPHEVFLVLDATTGQNAIFQTREFMEAANLTGLIITKLDGTSKGGVLIGIVNEFDIPVRFIGVGEHVDDLRPFDSKQFTESIFN